MMNSKLFKRAHVAINEAMSVAKENELKLDLGSLPKNLEWRLIDDFVYGSPIDEDILYGFGSIVNELNKHIIPEDDLENDHEEQMNWAIQDVINEIENVIVRLNRYLKAIK